MYAIRYTPGAADDLRKLAAYYRARVLAAIKTYLSVTPTRQRKHQKPLLNLVPPWEAVPPIWELRIGDYRVFYDVSHADQVVMVRAIRHKPPHTQTEDIL